MNQSTKKFLIRASLVGAAYTVLGLLVLKFVGESTGVSRGLEHTTGEGIFAFWLTFIFVMSGATYLFFIRWLPHPDLNGWVPQLLIAALVFSMVYAFVYLGPSIPLPD